MSGNSQLSDESRFGSSLLWAAGLVGLICLMAMVLVAFRVASQPSSQSSPAPVQQPPPIQGTTGDPPVGQFTPPPPNPPSSKPGRRLRVTWILEEGVKARNGPGLNLPVAETLARWQEVRWVEERNNWDKIRLEDGQDVWIESKYLTFTKPANLDNPLPAEQKVIDFYQAVARKDFNRAYTHLEGPWKAELSFDRFVDGYSHVVSLRTEIAHVVKLGPDRYQVDVAMVADEQGLDVDYLGSYVVVLVNERWEMASGILRRQ